ncbi:MAG: hypothetical protein V4649_19750 [Bacteroidota bacterium]
MATTNQDNKGQKKGPAKLPSKQITFSNQPVAKNGKQGKTSLNSNKKGGVNLMRKLSGM